MKNKSSQKSISDQSDDSAKNYFENEKEINL